MLRAHFPEALRGVPPHLQRQGLFHRATQLMDRLLQRLRMLGLVGMLVLARGFLAQVQLLLPVNLRYQGRQHRLHRVGKQGLHLHPLPISQPMHLLLKVVQVQALELVQELMLTMLGPIKLSISSNLVQLRQLALVVGEEEGQVLP